MGLAKQHRLKHWRDFRKVYGKGKRFHGHRLVLITYCDRDEMPKPATKVGISISRKVSKKAVVRNRIKRRIRSILRLFLPNIEAGWKVIIIVRSNAIECGYEDFLRELEKLLIKAEVLYGH